MIPEFTCSKFSNGVPEPTEPVVLPPLFPSILIVPPLWLNTEPKAEDKLPLMFNVPPVVVKVPLFVKGVLFKVHPTVKSPDATTRVPLELIVRLLDTLLAELTVTVCVPIITTLFEHVGTTLVFQVEPEFQLPDATDRTDVSVTTVKV